MDIFPSSQSPGVAGASYAFNQQATGTGFNMANDHSSHPNFFHLAGLVSEAVLEVVFVSSLGYIAASRGMFTQEAQKTMANLNIVFFTPCLIFSKLAKQLSGDKLLELWIIPVILLIQTIVSWCSAQVLSRAFRLRKKPQSNFVVAMAVFGNSNSLPLSLVISLSHTISGLHWDKIPGDNDNEVAARGILYLLIFSQLGQAARWSWGMNSLLKPMSKYTPAERGELALDDTESVAPYKDHPIDPSRPESSSSSTSQSGARGSDRTLVEYDIVTDEMATTSALTEPMTNGNAHQRTLVKLPNGKLVLGSAVPEDVTSSSTETGSDEEPSVEPITWRTQPGKKAKKTITNFAYQLRGRAIAIYEKAIPPMTRAFHSLPPPVQKVLSRGTYWIKAIFLAVLSCLNVPLMAIIVSVLVATIPPLKTFFYTPGSFVNNTFTSAINQVGGVAVPIILIVLGGNLCRSTQPQEDLGDAQTKREMKHMLICSILSRMLFPLIIMAPLLALTAKYLPVSIIDDPIFIIVCFLLTGAPSALQLAQICQVNDVFLPVVAKLLVHSYVIWIFPSTLVLVLLALEVVEWAV